ncbi:hypothetical protein VDG1235_3430 [Verrucomicrobiia bacterium DG1235]|nr:hypothetical protein VDG1235_3430 [Verrucomicrobiae bacterium DG1235]
MISKRTFRIGSVLSAVSIFLSLSGTGYGLNINLNANASLLSNTAAFDAFRRAADKWESVLSDDVTVTIDAGLESLGSSILGSTSNVSLTTSYDWFRGLMVADELADTSGINPVVGALPAASDLGFFLPTGFTLNGSISASKANIKALGYDGLDTIFGASDGTINFSSDFAFDFDNSDGVSSGLFDFESVAVHEIGHLLGFVSVVDQIDAMVENNLVGAVAPTLLDLFRFASVPGYFPLTLAEFATVPRVLLPGVASHFDTVEVKVPMSTGFFNGNGAQASHWLDDAGLGILDPTLSVLEVGALSSSDLLAMDVIGWDLRAVPDAVSSASLFLIGIGFACWARRRWPSLR